MLHFLLSKEHVFLSEREYRMGKKSDFYLAVLEEMKKKMCIALNRSMICMARKCLNVYGLYTTLSSEIQFSFLPDVITLQGFGWIK